MCGARMVCRPRRTQLADAEHTRQTGRPACRVRHELLEVVCGEPPPHPDGATEETSRSGGARRSGTCSSPSISPPSTASRPRGAAARWTSGRCARRRTTTTGSIAWSARPLAAPTGFASLRRPDRFASGASRGRRIDVRMRPQRHGHRAGAQAREAQGEAVGTSARETRVNLIPR